MIVIEEPKNIELELTTYEIESIIDELRHAPFNMYEFLGYGKIVNKLRKAMETGEKNENNN